MHRYKWADDGIGSDLISKDICPEHSNITLDNLCNSLENAFKQHSSIFPLYMRNFCHESLAHVFELIVGGFREDIDRYVVILQNNGFVHSAGRDITRAYSFKNDVGNVKLCMFERTGDRITHNVIIIRIHLDQIDDCKDILIDMVKNLES
jgi:hypothetical protein